MNTTDIADDSEQGKSTKRQSWLQSTSNFITTTFALGVTRLRKQTNVTDRVRRMSAREKYSGVTVAILEFFNALCVFIVQDVNSLSRFGISSSVFLNLCFCLVFIGAFFSHVVFYLHPLPFRTAFTVTAWSYAAGLCCFFTNSLILFLIGRFIVGLGTGIIASYLPSYLAEITPEANTLLFLGFPAIAFTSGVVVFNLGLMFIQGMSLYLPIALITSCALFPIFISLCCSPESTVQSHRPLASLFTNPRLIRPLFIITLLFVTLNLTGLNQITSNPRAIYGQDNAELHVILASVICIATVYASSWLCRRCGLKAMLLASSFFMITALVAFTYNINTHIFAYVFMIGFHLSYTNAPIAILRSEFEPEYYVSSTFYAVTVTRLSAATSMMLSMIPEHYKGFLFGGYILIIGMTTAMVLVLHGRSKRLALLQH